MVALSFVIFVFVVADKFNGSDGDGPPAAGATTSTPATGTHPVGVATSSTTSPSTTTESKTPAGSATAGPGGDNTPLVTCGDILAPLDKLHRLAADCAPNDLVALPASISKGGQQLMRSEAASALEVLFAAATRDGYQLFAESSYRSYTQQVAAFQANVQSGGLEYAERTSARPGHSEHQLGTTTDVASPTASFEQLEGTAEAKWIADNSWKYGFIVSYPTPESEAITGYAWEPWHIRWVGKDVASQVHNSGKTLHEFLPQ